MVFVVFVFSSLLLRELYEGTFEEHPDRENIGLAIFEIQKQASTLNKKIKSSQAANEVIAIQNKLCGDNIPVLLHSFI